jgi:hypothetical protein
MAEGEMLMLQKSFPGGQKVAAAARCYDGLVGCVAVAAATRAATSRNILSALMLR